MSETKTKKPGRINALDVMLVLLLVLVILGVAGRIFLDRYNSKGIEIREINYTLVLPESKAEQIKVGEVLYTESGNKLGSIVSIDRYQSEGDGLEDVVKGKYILFSGRLSVRGYEQKNGVFYTMDGEELRINTEISLKNGKNVYFYINDIVKNGQ